jgi:hypothetical protein
MQEKTFHEQLGARTYSGFSTLEDPHLLGQFFNPELRYHEMDIEFASDHHLGR